MPDVICGCSHPVLADQAYRGHWTGMAVWMGGIMKVPRAPKERTPRSAAKTSLPAGSQSTSWER